MWTDTIRKQFARDGLRLPSDLTDAECAVLEPSCSRFGEKVIDLLDATGKGHPIVLYGIERLYDVRLCILAQCYLLVIVSQWRANALRSFSGGVGGVSSTAKNALWSAGCNAACSHTAIVSAVWSAAFAGV